MKDFIPYGKKCEVCGTEINRLKPCGRKKGPGVRFCSRHCSNTWNHANSPKMKEMVKKFAKDNGKVGEAWGWVKRYNSLPLEEKEKYRQINVQKIRNGLKKNLSNGTESKAEQAFYSVLVESFPNIRIVRHECNLLPGYDFDFSFPDHRLLVEWDGPPHFDPGYYWFTNTPEQSLFRRRLNDDYKDRKIAELGWKIIRIHDDSYYKNGTELPLIMAKAIDRISYYISKDLTLSDIFLNSARDYSRLSTCNRLSVGTVIVKNGRIVSTGTNGSPSGLPHCKDVGCLINHSGHCVRTTHSEENAILNCMNNGVSTDGAILYCTDMPCTSCIKSIAQSGISIVCFERDYDDGTNKVLAKELKDRIQFFKHDGTMFRLIDSNT